MGRMARRKGRKGRRGRRMGRMARRRGRRGRMGRMGRMARRMGRRGRRMVRRRGRRKGRRMARRMHVAGGKTSGVVGEGAGVMYEVRSALKSGEEICRPFDESYDAWKAYYALVDQNNVESVGLYAIDRNGGEHEMECWSL